MKTSGTYGEVPVTVAALIDHAVRRTGKLPSTVSGELLLSARNNLYFLLLGLANRGLSLFCQQKQVLAAVPGLMAYRLQAGTVDVLRVNSRMSTPATGTLITGPNWQGLQLAAPDIVGSVSLAFAVDTTDEELSFEYSQDNDLWTAVATNKFPGSRGALFYQDLDEAPAAMYWRVRALDGTLPQINDLAWHGQLSELPMTPLNRTEYQLLPDKRSVGTRPLQYWYDKQVEPLLNIWPLSPDSQQQIVVWSQRHIQDPGALSGKLAVPARWYEAIIYQLAVRVAEELPADELLPGRLEYLNAKATEATDAAEDGESDGAPIRLTPNIRRYTRG